MKKMIFTLVLTIVSSAWMTNEASDRWCMPSVRTLTEPWIEVNGTFQAEGFPCEPDEVCPPCLTIVLVTSDKTYYLVTDDGQLIEQLDTIQLGTKATVSGIPFSHGSYDYIQVSHIETDRTSQLPSLCDEWNVLTTAIYEYSTRYFTFSQKLTTDTIIGENMYVKSEVEHKYNGAYREGENRDIYFVPAAMNKEFLVYAWNAQVGDTLYNILVSSYPMYALQYSDKAVVREIKETTPRTFIVDYEYIYNRKIDSADTIWWEYQWIEGIGMTCGPSGDLCPFDKCRDSIKSDLLCAYKNGEPIYTSPKGQQYGCKYNSIEYIEYADTIPLYAQDDPGSSTVDPVDPNQVVATLQGDQLTIHESTGVDVTYSLNHTAPAQVPSHNRAPLVNTFRDEVTIQITESGEYLLKLTNPSWGYTIVGRFNYVAEGIDNVNSSSLQGENKGRLIIHDGHLLILRGEKTYTITGQEVR